MNSGTKDTVFQFIAVGKYEHDKWTSARGTITCPCKAKCAKRIFKLKPNRSLYFAWDIKNDTCNNIYGKFRFEILKYRDQSTILAVSKTFELKKDENSTDFASTVTIREKDHQ